MLYLIDYECAHWCGGNSHCVVEAADADDAVMLASEHMQEEMYALFIDEYTDEDTDSDEYADEASFTVNSVVSFDKTHECWKYYIDPVQSQFFEKVN